MCSPLTIHAVRRELSRRHFVGALAACAAVVGGSPAAASLRRGAQQTPARLPAGFREVVDLTHPFTPALPVYPAYEPIRIRQRFSVAGDGFAANEVTFDEHTGTHVDAPSHFVAGAPSGDQIPAERLIAPLVVVGIAERAAKDPDTLVGVDDLLRWEKRHGRIPAGALVAMHGGWDARAGSPERFLNRDAEGVMHTPGFGAEAARFLVNERDIAAAGVDTLSLDGGAAQAFVAHLAFLGAGKYGVELLANLGGVPPAGATVIVGAPKHQGATGGPARVLALV